MKPMNDIIEAEVENEQPTSTEMIPSSTLAALVSAEIDMQVSTAKRYPRSLSQFKKTALSMATLNEEIAASCFYTLPRGGKPITGPSVRLAEICTVAWGNMRFGARVIADKGRTIVAQGFAIDLERNVAGTIEIERRITDKKGKRFSDDMVVVTGNAACAIAKRNAIFGVIPMAYVKEIEREARKVAIGDAKTLAAKRADMMAYFAKMGVDIDRLVHAVGKRAIEDVGLEELAILKGTATAIKDGDTSVDEAFPPVKADEPKDQPKSGAEGLKERLSGKLPNGTAPPKQEGKAPEEQAGSNPTDDQGGLSEEIEEIRGLIADSKTPEQLQEAGARMSRSEEIHKALLEDYQAKYKSLQPAAKSSRQRITPREF